VYSAASLQDLARYIVGFYRLQRISSQQCALPTVVTINWAMPTSVCNDMMITGCFSGGCALYTYYLDDASAHGGGHSSSKAAARLMSSASTLRSLMQRNADPSSHLSELPWKNSTLRLHVEVHLPHVLPTGETQRLWDLQAGGPHFRPVATVGMGYFNQLELLGGGSTLRALYGVARGWQVVRYLEGGRVAFLHRDTLVPLPVLNLHFVGPKKHCIQHYARPRPANFTCVGCMCEEYVPCKHGANGEEARRRLGLTAGGCASPSLFGRIKAWLHFMLFHS
jgi:hypothetical protein